LTVNNEENSSLASGRGETDTVDLVVHAESDEAVCRRSEAA
jgi:hypothetical protein